MQLNALLPAACVVDGFRYTARTYQISEHQLTLVTSPDFPEVEQFVFDCRLDDSHQALLHLNTRQRKPVRWQGHAFHMLETEIDPQSNTVMAAFVDHLKQHFENETRTTAEAAERRARGEEVTQEEASDKRLHIRLTFNLPVLAAHETAKYQGMTRDFSIRGIGATFKEIIPQADSMNLVCQDPDGQELTFRVREMNRQIEKSDSFPLRIGFKILSANKRYREFLEKHHLWNLQRQKDSQ